MKRAPGKSECPINYTLERFGDQWSFLILRDIAMFGKKTFSEFLGSDEHIGSSVLTERLACLEKEGIIRKRIDKKDKRSLIYGLTTKGLTILSVIYEAAVWGAKTSKNQNVPKALIQSTRCDRILVLKTWQESLSSGSSFFAGPNSVVKKLNL